MFLRKLASFVYSDTPTTVDKEFQEKIKNKLIAQKGLSPHIFFEAQKISLKDEMAAHVAWAFENIYSKPYQESKKEKHKLAREHHGIQHVTRAAMYTPVFANLYRRYGDKEALALTDDDLKLIQIAVIFHDAGRQGDGIDLWDNDSALLLFFYLTRVLHVNTEKAKQLAESVANKDAKKSFFELKFDCKGNTAWVETKPRQKNIYQKLIHDADCLDIIRARDHFEADYLDFYKCIAEKNADAFEVMAQFITEARSLIELQGDGRERTIDRIKREYEHKDAHAAQLASIKLKHYKVIPAMFGGGNLLSGPELNVDILKRKKFNPDAPLTVENMQAALDACIIKARAVATPSAFRKKIPKSTREDSGREEKYPAEETLAALEIRKAYRRFGEKTRTTKPDNMLKNGNPHRSVSLLGSGGTVFANAGFLIVKQNDEHAIEDIHEIDSGTGRDKKNKYDEKQTELTIAEKRTKYVDLIRKQKMGGSSIRFRNFEHYPSTHTELIYHLTEFDAVYFSQDPNLYNVDVANETGYALHPSSPILQAIFLQKTLKKEAGIEVPIFEYSGIHNKISAWEGDDNTIMALWISMCSDYIKKQLQNKAFYDVLTFSINDIKTLSMYGSLYNEYAKCNAPADTCYSQELQNKLNKKIEQERGRLIAEYKQQLLQTIQSGKKSVFDEEIFHGLLHFQDLRRDESVISQVKVQVKLQLANPALNTMIEKCSSKQLYTGNLIKLFTNKNHYLKSESGLAKHYYEDDLIKLYDLAVTMQMDDVVHILKTKAILQIQKRFLELQTVIKKADFRFYMGYLDIEQIIRFATAFDVYDDIRSELLSLTHKLFTATTAYMSDHNPWQHYRILVETFKTFHLVDPSSLFTARQMASEFGARLSDGRVKIDDSELTQYLAFAMTVQLDLSEVKNVVIICLEKITHFHLSINAIVQSKLTDDKEIFQALLTNKARYVTSEIAWDTPSDRFVEYIQDLERLKNDLPGAQFSAWQLDFVNETTKKLAREVMSFMEKKDEKKDSVLKGYHHTKPSISDFKEYLHVARHADLPSKEIQGKFSLWIDNSDFFDKAFFTNANIKLIRNLITDLDIFAKLISKIEPKNFNYAIEAIKKQMSMQKFSHEQMVIINKVKETLKIHEPVDTIKLSFLKPEIKATSVSADEKNAEILSFSNRKF